MSKKNTNKPKGKSFLVVGVDPNRYQRQDKRFMKPLLHQKCDMTGDIKESALFQETETVKISKRKEIDYIVPNNIALSLSVSDEALRKAKKIHAGFFADLRGEEDSISELVQTSSLVCDYIEAIQTSIVFSYTALEVFANLSIPVEYTYILDKEQKGISEIYDKRAIERWLSLTEKIKKILPNIYKTKKIEKEKFWGKFVNLERYRHDIIHQKSIERTDFYKMYFKQSIFDVCNSSVDIINFFYSAHSEKDRTNPMWPWLENDSMLPRHQMDSSTLEVVGNIHEDKKI